MDEKKCDTAPAEIYGAGTPRQQAAANCSCSNAEQFDAILRGDNLRAFVC